MKIIKQRGKKKKQIEFNPAHTSHGYRNVRWVENVSCGLRLVGFADKIAGLRHQGWFTEDNGDNGEVFRGVVYQLPAHGSEGTCYVYGYADPNNDDCALLCFDIIGDKEDAARAADRFAELCAESERDYNRAWQAGLHYSDLGDEIKTMRTKALALGAEMRAAKKTGIYAPTICAALRGEIASIYRRIQKAYKERKELLASYRDEAAFKDA